MRKEIGLALAKIFVAGGWSDGRFGAQNTKLVDEFLKQVPGMTHEDKLPILLYQEYAVSNEEQKYLSEMLKYEIQGKVERDEALQIIDKYLNTHRNLSREEKIYYVALKTDLEVMRFSSLGKITKAFGNNKPKPDSSQTREIYMDDYVRNPVYFRFWSSLPGGEFPGGIDGVTYQKVCLGASMMVRAAHADGSFTDEEKIDIVMEIYQRWGVKADIAEMIVDIAAEHDDQRLRMKPVCEKFAELSTEIERQELFNALIQALESDSALSRNKLERIRTVGQYMGVDMQMLIETTERLKQNKPDLFTGLEDGSSETQEA